MLIKILTKPFKKVEVQSDFGAAIKPLWKKQDNTVKEKNKIFTKNYGRYTCS